MLFSAQFCGLSAQEREGKEQKCANDFAMVSKKTYHYLGQKSMLSKVISDFP
jgi:hypothetical protein